MARSHEEVFERVLDASRETVWKAWTDPKLVAKWWGPNGVTIPECELEPRVGGKIYIVMLAGEAMGPFKGTRWPMKGVFTAVEPLRRLTYEAQAWTEGQGPETQINTITDITFQDQQGKTKVTIKATITNADTAPKMAVQGMTYGFNQQLDKLVGFVASKDAATIS
jgi:uncharacterized protein YndB with AHSA1/START domain